MGFLKGFSLTTYLLVGVFILGSLYHVYSKSQSFAAGYNKAVVEYQQQVNKENEKIIEDLKKTFSENLESEIKKRRQVEKDIVVLNQELVKIKAEEKGEILENTQCVYIDSDLARLRNSFFGDKPILNE